MTKQALVVGGTGPTGPFVVNGLRERGYQVTILHTGRHEVAEIPSDVAHIHTDPFDGTATSEALGSATFDLGIVMYGRLRVLAPLLVGRVGYIITIGGVGAVKGWVDPRDLVPTSMTVPTPVEPPLAAGDEPIGKIRRIVETEQVVFDHHPDAIHLRYPMLYGPRQMVPREWPVVRRALDGRRPMILADGGLTLKSAAYVENAAHAVMCAVDALGRPQSERGSSGPSVAGIYNVTDDRTLTIKQICEVVGQELGHEFAFVNLPYELAPTARPLIMHWSSGHRVVNTERLRSVLGYRDLVEPEEGLRRTVRWLVANPPGPGTEARLQDPFDYRAEDDLIARWNAMVADFDVPSFSAEPGYGAAYYGRDPNPATGTSRVETAMEGKR